jgi:hypothetical protein
MQEQPSVSGIIYTAAGHPPTPSGTSGICRVCGERGDGVPFEAWVKDTFMDHDKLRCSSGAIICGPCWFTFDDASAPLAVALGKPEPQRMRNYSHFVAEGRWLPMSKARKSAMRDLLIYGNPQVAVIADSGQKHLIFRATPGWWQFEEFALRPMRSELARSLTAVEALYTPEKGFSKTEIETGRYQHNRILAFGLSRWSECDAAVRGLRGSPAFRIALFLAQKDEDQGEPTKDE